MTDFRALCAELADNLERYQCWYIEDNGYGISDLEALLRRASTALAQPEPQSSAMAWCRSDDFNDAAKKKQSFSGWREQHPDCDLALCVFPVTAQPEPQGPTLDCDEIQVPVWHRGDDFYVYKEGYTAGWAAGVNATADCWGRPAIEPVPVAERLPGPEDCAPWPDEPDANPWCWTGKEVDGGWEWNQIGLLGVDAKNLGRVLGGGGWTHWLPHHALPVPQNNA